MFRERASGNGMNSGGFCIRGKVLLVWFLTFATCVLSVSLQSLLICSGTNSLVTWCKKVRIESTGSSIIFRRYGHRDVR